MVPIRADARAGECTLHLHYGLQSVVLALDPCGEHAPSLGVDTQHRAALAVLGVTNQDRAGNASGLNAVRPAVAAVAGLAPAGVYLVHLSSASISMFRLSARLSASPRTASKVADARLTSAGSAD